MKIKGEEYKRLHRILTNISNRNIWEYLKDGKPLDELIDKVPDEFYDWVKETKENFENEFQKIKEEYESLYNSILNSNEIFSRKDFAGKAINSNFPSILFSMYDNRPYDQIIWKILYPDYSKPFKKNNDV
jgi:RNA ligase